MSFKIIFQYYYWLIYYFMFSFSCLPKISNNKIQLFLWCSVMQFKLWNYPCLELCGLNSMGYENMIEYDFLFPVISSRSSVRKILLKSYIYRWIYLFLIIWWPF
eukprot:531985_1